MKCAERAKELYLSGFCCSESVLHALWDCGLAEFPEEFLRISTGFLAGIGHQRCLCGALAAANMAVSLKYGRVRLEENKDLANEKCAALFQRFTEQYGAACCREVSSTLKTGVEFTDPMRRNYCAEVVASAAQLAEELITNR